MAIISYMKYKQPQGVAAQFLHCCKDTRVNHKHGNEHIDDSRTHLNYATLHEIKQEDGRTVLREYTYRELFDAYANWINTLDKSTNKNKKKNRVTMVCMEVPAPEDLNPSDRESWFEDMLSELKSVYGEYTFLDMQIHYDEVHEYTKTDGSTDVMSRVHAHTFWIPVVNGELNCYKYVTRINMREANKAVEKMSVEKYGVRFNSGNGQKNNMLIRQLKNDSYVARRERYKQMIEIMKQNLNTYEEIVATLKDHQHQVSMMIEDEHQESYWLLAAKQTEEFDSVRKELESMVNAEIRIEKEDGINRGRT